MNTQDRSFNVKLVGVSHKNPDGMARQAYIRRFAKSGMPVHLRPEPNNPHDADAIGAWITARSLLLFTADVQIGYLDSRLAGEVSRLLARGGTATARIVEVSGGTSGAETLGVVIELTKTEPGDNKTRP